MGYYVQCPNCGQPLKVFSEDQGRRVECDECGVYFRAKGVRKANSSGWLIAVIVGCGVFMAILGVGAVLALGRFALKDRDAAPPEAVEPRGPFGPEVPFQPFLPPDDPARPMPGPVLPPAQPRPARDAGGQEVFQPFALTAAGANTENGIARTQ